MATSEETTPRGKTTIIVSTSLQNHGANRMLSAQQHRLRFSDSVESGAFIFPLSAVCFLHFRTTEGFLTFGVRLYTVFRFPSVERVNTALPLAFLKNTCTAFLLVDPQDHLEHFEETGLLERIKTFVQVHRNSFLLLFAPFNGRRELEMLSVIQHRFFGSNLRILPVRNNAEVVKGMLTIAKATSKPHVERIRERMSLARARIIESSPVWKKLRDVL